METILPGLNGALSLHPVLVHFPIALLATALLFQVIGYLANKDDAFRLGAWLLAVGLLSGVAAVLTGWHAAESLGHDDPNHSFVHQHRNMMLVALVLAGLAAGASHWVLRRPLRRRLRWVPIAILLLANMVTALGADRGGRLVYEFGMGTALRANTQSESSDHDASGALTQNHPTHSH